MPGMPPSILGRRVVKLTPYAKKFLLLLSAHGIAREVKIPNGFGHLSRFWRFDHEDIDAHTKPVEKLVAAGYAIRLLIYGSPTLGISSRGRWFAGLLSPVKVGELRPRLRGGKY